MKLYFDQDYLADLYTKGGTKDKKHRYQPDVIKKYVRTIDVMKRVANVWQLTQYRGLRYEHLRGDKDGLSSVRVNDQYRIEFKEYIQDGDTIASICNIVDLSNHYE